MKTCINIFFSFCLFFPHFAFPQNEFSMIPSEWTYYYKEKMNDSQFVFCVEWWDAKGTKEVGNHQYIILNRNFAYCDGGISYVKGLWYGYTLNDEGEEYPTAVGDVISIREEKGKVFALKDEFLSFMQQLYPDESDFYFCPSDNENEVLIYDFTLEVGDTYPCEENIRVDSTFTFVSRDNISRRGLRLQNGCILLEGIGCINSIGSLIAYQNTIKAYSNVWTYLELCRQKYDTSYIDVYRENDLQLLSRISNPVSYRISDNNFYDPNGRRVVNPKRGLYIQGGKKVMIK